MNGDDKIDLLEENNISKLKVKDQKSFMFVI